MTGRVAHIWRHPVKSAGREELREVTLEAGRTMPWDRAWAVAHDAARLGDGPPDWAPCANFSIGAKAPRLQAVRARLDTAAARVTLSHPDRPEITVAPDDPADAARLVDWLTPLMPEGRAMPARVLRVPGRGMTDTDFPSVSLNNLSSHRAVEGRLGQAISPLRWRGNFLIDGLGPWEEFEWIGRTIRIGDAEIAVRERIQRCMATTANPDTGRRDADTLGALESGWDHRDFGIYGEVVTPGRVARGDAVTVLR